MNPRVLTASTTDGTDSTDFYPSIRGIRGQKLAALALALFLHASPAAPAQAGIQPEVVPASEPSRVFGGGARTLPVVWRNRGDQPATFAPSTRLYQASSATAAPLSQTPWKELTILPGQTVLESVTLDVPAVRAETRFLAQWVQNSNNVLGVTEVWAYPTNILRELGGLAGTEPAGLYDPQDQLKPLLRAVSVEYVDLEAEGLERFVGRLVIVGPFASRAQVCEWLPDSLRSLAMRGVAVIWLLPPLELRGKIKPSFYTVLAGKGAVVVVQAGVLSDLAQSPQAQLDLVDLCRQAVKPQPLQLPFLASQP
ncbi:MAG TPA: hypothetical protein VET69_01775 [Terriglobales bacterium]|nr:hypothetical protein [Terriglobales bacterium]